MRHEPIYITYSKSQNAFNRERDLASMAMSNLRQLRDVIAQLNRILSPEESTENVA
jgi:hypothetical protein